MSQFTFTKLKVDPPPPSSGQIRLFGKIDDDMHVQNDQGVVKALGNMAISKYDPQGISGDAFNTDNHTTGAVNTVFSQADKTKLDSVGEISDGEIVTNKTWSSSKIDASIPTKVIVNSINDFGTPVGDVITLANNTEYVLNAPITDDKRFVLPVGAAIRFTVVGATSNFYNYTGAGVLFTGADITAVEFVSWIFIAPNGTVFDISSTNPDAYILNVQVLYQSVNIMGTINDAAFFMFQTSLAAIDSGLVLNDNPVVKMNGCNNFLWNNIASTVYFTFTGTQGQINVTDFTSIPQSNEAIFDFPPGTTYTAGIVLNSVGFLAAGGTLFSSTSLDQTDPKILLFASPPEPDSAVIGSMYWLRNTTNTVISVTGTSGDITAFADAGGGLTLVTSTGHGLSNGNTVDISETTNYNGRFIIANVTANTYTIPVVFVSDDATGRWQFGWVKIGGTTFAAELERCTMPANNKLSFINNEKEKGEVKLHLTVIKGAGGGSSNFEFCLFKNGKQLLTSSNDALLSVVYVSVSSTVQLTLVVPTSVISGDNVEVFVRNVNDSDDILIQHGSVVF